MLFVSLVPPTGDAPTLALNSHDGFDVVSFISGRDRVEIHTASAKRLADALAVIAYGQDARITTALVEETPEYDSDTCEYCNRPFCNPSTCTDAECIGCHV